MKKFTLLAGMVALAIAVPIAQANDEHPNKGKKDNPPGQNKPHHENNGKKPESKPNKCTPHKVGYNARGTLVSSSLTQTKGADTAKKGDDRWSGDLTVNVTKANHKAPTGEQTFTLTDARVRFADTDDNNVPDTPKAGDRVKLHGKITKLNRKCDQTGFKPEITVKHVRFRGPKPPANPPEEKKQS